MSDESLFWIIDQNGIETMSSIPTLILCGQSGAGKTALAQFIVSAYGANFEIIPNSTTREPRYPDEPYFKFLSKEDFNQHIERNDFYFYRKGGNILYGYLKSDYNSIVSRGHIPIFMFRLSGIEQLYKHINNCHVCIINSDIILSQKHTETKEKDKYVSDAQGVINGLNTVEMVLIEKGIPSFRIRNLYDSSFFSTFEQSEFFKSLLEYGRN